MSQALDWGSWLSLTRKQIYLIWHVKVRIAREGARRSMLYCVRGSRALSNLRTTGELHHSGSPLCRGLDQGHLHPLHRASETEASQSGIEPGTSCTVTRRAVKFRYIHMMTPDDNGPRYFPYESGINTCLAPAVFNTSGIFPRYTAWKKVKYEHRVGSNLRS